jgi:hypothetical protein
MMQVGTDGYCHTMVLWPANALSTLLDRARPGDTVVLPTGDLAGAAGVIAVPGLRLTSPGPGAVLHADGRNAEGKAILVVRAPGVRIENIGFRGARVPAGNGAGIRFEAGSLVLDRCSFLDNEMGLLTAGRPDMALAVHHCVFGDAPRHDSGQLHHLLYAGAIGQLVVTHSRFHRGWRGHLLKSRARINRILFNELDDGPDGGAAYELEFPDGGDNLVLGNRIGQGAGTHNPALLSLGAEADRPGSDAARRSHRLDLRRNRFVNRFVGDAERTPRFVHLWPDRLPGPLAVEAAANVFEGPGVIGLP